MKTVFEHIEHIKGKPHHIRRRVAFAVAAGGSGLIALVWLVGSFAMGSFAIQGSDFAMSTGQGNTVATTSDSVNQGLAGVGAASALQDTRVPAHIEIVDTTPTPTPTPTPTSASGKNQSEQTILPF